MTQWFRSIDIEPPPPRYIILPYYGIPMWNNQCYDYAQCPKCAKLLTTPCRIGIRFISTLWKIVLFCNDCVGLEYSSYCGIPAMEIESVLKPIIDKNCQKIDHTCTVCGQWKCTNTDCDEIYSKLQRTELDDLFEHFIVIKTDIVTPLRFPVCHNIDCKKNIEGGKQYSCDICRRVCYCSKACKKICSSHYCTEYLNCWRQ